MPSVLVALHHLVELRRLVLLPCDGFCLRVGGGVWVVLRPEDGAPDGTGDDLGRGRVEQLHHPGLLDVVEEVLGAVKVPQPLPLRGGSNQI